MKFTYPAVRLTPFYLWVCLYHTFAARCLRGSHLTILSKSNYRVRLNVNMKIADSISFYFNFGKGHHFVLRVKQHIFDKARFFEMNRVDPAMVDWREKEVETFSCRSLSFENFLGKTKSVRCIIFPWHHDVPNDRTRNNLNNINSLKCYSSDEPARGFLSEEC